MHRKAFNNPHAPLINVTLECRKMHYMLSKKIDIWAYDWPGVTEKMVRKCIHGVVSGWEFQSWESSDCSTSHSNVCQWSVPGWHARFHLPYEGKESFMRYFHYLTGMYGKHVRDETEFMISDGNHTERIGVRDLIHEKNEKRTGWLFDKCYYLV